MLPKRNRVRGNGINKQVSDCLFEKDTIQDRKKTPGIGYGAMLQPNVRQKKDMSLDTLG